MKTSILVAIMTGLCLTPTACTAEGSSVNAVVPQSQQQTQDTVMSYLKRTLHGLPAGTVIDATRYGSAGSTGYCDDNDSTHRSEEFQHHR